MGNCLGSPAPKTAPSKPTAAATGTKRFEAIRDRFETVAEVQEALRKAGLESSDLILAIDLTKSNEWSGKDSFHGAHPSRVVCCDCHTCSHACSALGSPAFIVLLSLPRLAH